MAIMAGMLAGADSARRRRQRQLREAKPTADPAAVGPRRSSSSSSSSSSLFSHITKRSETQYHSVAAQQIIKSNNNNNYINRELYDWNLGSGAREAKERLDEKLRNQRASVIRSRRYSMASVVSALQREIFSCGKRKSARRFTWSKLVWNKTTTSAEAEAEAKADHGATECAVCLEEFRAGDELTHLPCAHRFHRSCAVPWLEISPNCPFCRTCIFSTSK